MGVAKHFAAFSVSMITGTSLIGGFLLGIVGSVVLLVNSVIKLLFFLFFYKC